MDETVKFDIKGIMEQTHPMYDGKNLEDYISVYVASVWINNKPYSLYTIYDPDKNYRNLILADENLNIVRNI